MFWFCSCSMTWSGMISSIWWLMLANFTGSYFCIKAHNSLTEMFFFSLCSLELCEWRGQNQRTLMVGWFPASLTVPSLPPNATAGNSGPSPASSSAYISSPLKGSLQHVAHGDIKPERTWGIPESVDESVLQLIIASLSYLGSLVFAVSMII